MAKKVDAWPTNTRGARYPWDEWLDGDIWALETGKDFGMNAENFRAQVYIAAKNRGMTVTTARKGKILYVKAVTG